MATYSGRLQDIRSRTLCGHRAEPCRPLQVVELYGLGGLPLFAATGPLPSLGLDPLRRHVQPDHAFADLGDGRWWQIQLGREEAAGCGQHGLARAHNRSEPYLFAIIDEPASRDVREPERASWGPVSPTDDRRARQGAPPLERSIRHRRHPSPRARRGLRRDWAVLGSSTPDELAEGGRRMAMPPQAGRRPAGAPDRDGSGERDALRGMPAGAHRLERGDVGALVARLARRVVHRVAHDPL